MGKAETNLGSAGWIARATESALRLLVGRNPGHLFTDH